METIIFFEKKCAEACVCEKKVVILQAILEIAEKDVDYTQHSTNSGSGGPACPLPRAGFFV